MEIVSVSLCYWKMSKPGDSHMAYELEVLSHGGKLTFYYDPGPQHNDYSYVMHWPEAPLLQLEYVQNLLQENVHAEGDERKKVIGQMHRPK